MVGLSAEESTPRPASPPHSKILSVFSESRIDKRPIGLSASPVVAKVGGNTRALARIAEL